MVAFTNNHSVYKSSGNSSRWHLITAQWRFEMMEWMDENTGIVSAPRFYFQVYTNEVLNVCNTFSLECAISYVHNWLIGPDSLIPAFFNVNIFWPLSSSMTVHVVFSGCQQKKTFKDIILGFEKTIIDIFHHFLTFYRPNNSSINRENNRRKSSLQSNSSTCYILVPFCLKSLLKIHCTNSKHLRHTQENNGKDDISGSVPQQQGQNELHYGLLWVLYNCVTANQKPVWISCMGCGPNRPALLP